MLFTVKDSIIGAAYVVPKDNRKINVRMELRERNLNVVFKKLRTIYIHILSRYLLFLTPRSYLRTIFDRRGTFSTTPAPNWSYRMVIITPRVIPGIALNPGMNSIMVAITVGAIVSFFILK